MNKRSADAAYQARFPVVGMGASAGGLGAFEQFFHHDAPGCGMAFVLAEDQREKSVGVLLNARRICSKTGDAQLILLAMEQVP